MKLTAENVDKMFEESQKEDGDLKVNILGREVRFNSQKINKEELHEILKQLPDSFQEKSGGGMSFLNACMDKNGCQWGEQMHVARLMGMGIASGLAYYCMPESMWSILPGGMPYFGVKE